ncbi:MAG: hypothetical protein JWP00_4922 [Chloroflexi bacterium]|nr:hypothetical protein [Chloroflexota bacterium]
MSVPPPNPLDPYNRPTINPAPVYRQGPGPDYVVPVQPVDPLYTDPFAPSIIENLPSKRRVPLWVPIIAIGGLLAAAIAGISLLNNQNRTQTYTPVAVITVSNSPTVTQSGQVVVPAATNTPVIQNLPTATPLPQNVPAQAAPAPTATPPPAQAAPPPAAANAPAPTATPRPAPTVPPGAHPAPPPVAAPTPAPPPTAAPAAPAAAPTPTAVLQPTATPVKAQPTATPVPPTATATQAAPTATPVPLNSRAIGLFKTEWEKWHGQGDVQEKGVYYENKKYLIGFFQDRIIRLERYYDPAAPVTLDAARTESKTFLPEDAQLVKTYDGPNNIPVDLYKSEALKTYFAGVTDPDFWKGGEPGNFIVEYRKSDKENMFSTIVITLGNNPQKQP